MGEALRGIIRAPGGAASRNAGPVRQGKARIIPFRPWRSRFALTAR